jgi:Ca2+-binding EF-hand superfamily protein
MATIDAKPEWYNIGDKSKAAKKYDLDEETIEQLCQAFELFDVSGDGGIGEEELHRVLTATGRQITLEETKKLIEEIERKAEQTAEPGQTDDGRHGELDIHEFMELMAAEIHEDKLRKSKDEFEEAFETFGA